MDFNIPIACPECKTITDLGKYIVYDIFSFYESPSTTNNNNHVLGVYLCPTCKYVIAQEWQFYDIDGHLAGLEMIGSPYRYYEERVWHERSL